MDPIQILMDEHRVIEGALGALEKFAGDVETKKVTDGRKALTGFVEFIREFADRLHHGKEEDILFNAMIENGFPREGGPIAVMLADHDQGRSYVAAMKSESAKPSWNDGEREEVVAAARGYATLLRQHIYKEDHILYPMAKMHLPADVLDKIGADVVTFEADPRNRSDKSRLLGLAKELCGQ